MVGTPDLLANRDEVRRMLERPPMGLFLDLDGTIAAFAPTPDAVIIRRPVLEALDALSQRMTVTVLTGRQAAVAHAMVGLDSLIYAGNHGAEWWEAGVAWTVPEVAEVIPRLRALAKSVEEALAGISGLVIEDKGASLSVHYRLAESPQEARDTIMGFLERAPEVRGLSIREGKRVVEVRAAVAVDKGTALRRVVQRRGLRSAARRR